MLKNLKSNYSVKIYYKLWRIIPEKARLIDSYNEKDQYSYKQKHYELLWSSSQRNFVNESSSYDKSSKEITYFFHTK